MGKYDYLKPYRTNPFFQKHLDHDQAIMNWTDWTPSRLQWWHNCDHLHWSGPNCAAICGDLDCPRCEAGLQNELRRDAEVDAALAAELDRREAAGIVFDPYAPRT